MYSEDLIREAVDIVIGDDGMRSAEVIEVLKILKKEIKRSADETN
tara:strand:- start:57 stop:191 length:135 start_codon:yes stop_codon:yes gene_type:complete